MVDVFSASGKVWHGKELGPESSTEEFLEISRRHRGSGSHKMRRRGWEQAALKCHHTFIVV
jgi:hypothetical protein